MIERVEESTSQLPGHEGGRRASVPEVHRRGSGQRRVGRPEQLQPVLGTVADFGDALRGDGSRRDRSAHAASIARRSGPAEDNRTLSVVVVRVLLFAVLPLVLAVVHVWLDERVRDRAQRLEVFFLYVLAVGVVGSAIGGFFAHAFLADEVAESIGWPAGNPFQREVAFANLALGTLGILAMNRRDGFREATVIAVTIFAGGATITHVIDIVETGNLAAGNTVQNLANLLRPAVLIWLLLAIRRTASAEGHPDEPALSGAWRDTAVTAAAQATAVVSAAFSIGYAVDQPAIGAAVGGLLAAAATAHTASRASPRHR